MLNAYPMMLILYFWNAELQENNSVLLFHSNNLVEIVSLYKEGATYIFYIISYTYKHIAFILLI